MLQVQGSLVDAYVTRCMSGLFEHKAVFHHKKQADQEGHAQVVFSARRFATHCDFFLLKGVFLTRVRKAEETELFEKQSLCLVVSTVNPLLLVDEYSGFAQHVVHDGDIRHFPRVRGQHANALAPRLAQE